MSVASMGREGIAANVRAEVARRKISQPDIAAAFGENQQWVSRRITGHVPWKADELEVIASILGMHVAELVGGRAPDGWVPAQRESLGERWVAGDLNPEPADYAPETLSRADFGLAA